MLHRKWIARSISILLCALMSVPTVAAEAIVSTLARSRPVLDIQLQEDGSILGKLVDRQGQALANVDVQVLTQRAIAANVKTDVNGVFTARGLSAGELAVRVGNELQRIRAWNADMAPPSASPAALLVVGDAVRGQCFEQPCPAPCVSCEDCGGCGSCDACCSAGNGLVGGGWGGHSGGGLGHRLLARPWLLGAGVAAAIAIPLALDDDDAS